MFVEVTRTGRVRANRLLIPLDSIIAIEEDSDVATILYIAEAYRKPIGDIEAIRVTNTYNELKFLMMTNHQGHLNPKENNVKKE